MALTTDVDHCLRILRAAVPGQHPVLDEATVQTWHALLERHQASDLTEAALHLAETRLMFPSAAEFVEAVGDAQRRRIARQEAIARGPVAPGEFRCARCQDSGWVIVGGPEYKTQGGHSLDGGEGAMPCPNCRAADHDYWNSHHMSRDHVVSACENPRCEARAAKGVRRR